jgi:hypothetical protein
MHGKIPAASAFVELRSEREGGVRRRWSAAIQEVEIPARLGPVARGFGAVAAAVGFLALLITGLASHGPRGPVELSAEAFMTAVSRSDAAGACAQITVGARQQLMADYGRGTCPEAITEMVRNISPHQLQQLSTVGAYDTKITGSSATTRLTSDLLGFRRIGLTEIHGAWVVSRFI